MNYSKLFVLLSVIILGQFVQVGAFGQVSSNESPFKRDFGSVKILDAYFGTLNQKIEVAPGDKNVPFTLVFANVGTQDITGIKGQLQLPTGFSAADGKGALILADSDSESKAGSNFSLTFFVNLDEHIPIQQYPGTVKVDYSRLRESGQRNEFFEFKFKVTGDSTLNLKALDPFLTSIKNNKATIEISNSGTAPISNVKVILENTQNTISSTQTSITNVENVVFDQNNWDVGTIEPKSSKYISFQVYIPENVHTETLHTPMEITYFNAHGDKVETKRNVDFYINGLIDLKIYNVNVIDLSGKQTVIGEIINEGNTNALFGFVTLAPLEDSNIKKTTEFIDEIETDSPVPFNIPVEFNGEPKFGEHKIKITLRYKDDLRNEHLLDYDTTVFLKDTTKKPAPIISDYVPSIVGLAIVIAAGVIVFKKIRKKKEPVPS